MFATSSLASVVIIANVRIHSPEAGSFQFSQMPPTPKGRPSFMAIAYGCLAFCPLIAIHSKEPVHRNDAASGPVSVAERRQDVYGPAFGVDRLSPTLRVITPTRNETPAQRVE